MCILKSSRSPVRIRVVRRRVFQGVCNAITPPEALAASRGSSFTTYPLLRCDMDYSGVSAESDALAGSSPWGSSSPRAGRTPYNPPTPNPSMPDSPNQPSGHQHTSSQDSISANPFANEASATTQALPPPASQDPPSEPQHAPAQEPSPAQEQSPQQQSAAQGHPQMRPAAARYHSARQQRPVPAYKLQAKVTALERTGRKDPVIRFDVYVRLAPPML